jgi:arylsulfatase A-like enzyme
MRDEWIGRREFLAAAVGAAAAGLLGGCGGNLASADQPATRPTTAAARRPNIVLIVADDLGYADIGAQGISKDVRTPHIDALAAAGTRLTNGYVSCPVCSPTRAGLMTGRYQQRFGHEFNPGPNEAETFGLPVDQVTLAQVLKDAGYATGMVGKWHLGFRPEMHPTQRGFDEFFGFLAGAHGYDAVGQGRNALLRGTTPVESTDYLTDAFGREAAAFVERHAGGDKPFFLYLAFNAVHTPMQAPPKYLERFAGVADEKRRTMLAMLSAMDDAVGLVTDELRKAGAADDTLVFFLTDNGGPTRGNGSLNTPLRGTKGSTYEGGIRVPFLVTWPGRVPAGRVYEAPAIALDVFPTALAAAGAAPPRGETLDGVDLLPHLAGRAGAAPHDALYWRFGSQWAVREADYKLVRGGPEGVQLFDLSSDVGETNDLIAAKPDVAERLRAKYEAWNATLERPRWRDSRDGRPATGPATRPGGGGARRRRRAATTAPRARQ